jgi:hypothetical protein
MQNLLILYNPYYQKNVIKEHLEVLLENEEVAFGKLKSKLKVTSHPFEEKLQELIQNVNEENYLQLFLTDYSSIYVAKVINVSTDDLSAKAPAYYKNHNVEAWFLIDDMYEIIRDEFESVRDKILANFTTPNYGNHTFALYGNNYVYPLIVEQKNEIDYFLNVEDKLYKNIYKSEEYLKYKNILYEYVFGDLIYVMHPRSLDNIISAEIEYQHYKKDLTYDFNSIVIKYSKVLELEIYLFLKRLFSKIYEEIKEIKYSVQGIEFCMNDFFTHKPNLGTMRKLLKTPKIKSAIFNKFSDKNFTFFTLQKLPNFIKYFQDIRNESVHGKSACLGEVKNIRNKILGVKESSFLNELLNNRDILTVS